MVYPLPFHVGPKSVSMLNRKLQGRARQKRREIHSWSKKDNDLRLEEEFHISHKRYLRTKNYSFESGITF